MPVPGEYFEARERALLGTRYDVLYAAPCAVRRGVTVNGLRCAPQEFAAAVDFGLEPSPFCDAAFLLTDPQLRPGRHAYHHAGVFYVQEPSASVPAGLLGVRPGERVLDLCAAPGGKTSQLAAALRGEGLLVANEYVAARAGVLKSNLERMGVTNALVLNESTARVAAAFPAFFDKVLVDAPCSGEGMFRKEPEALRQHSAALVAQCAALGASILDDAAAARRPAVLFHLYLRARGRRGPGGRFSGAASGVHGAARADERGRARGGGPMRRAPLRGRAYPAHLPLPRR